MKIIDKINFKTKFTKIQKRRLKANQKLKEMCKKRNDENKKERLIEINSKIEEIKTTLVIVNKI